MELKGKNIFITGSTRGIGLAMAHKFASLGANIVLNGRREIGEELISEFSDYGVQVIPISGDVSDSTDAKRMVEEAIEKLGSMDILVNNAGITKDKLMLKLTEEDFEQVLKVNLVGAFNMTQAVLKPMTKARQGAIINVSSVVGLIGNVGQANYAASKAGVIGFSKSVALELGSRNIRCNAIAPGFIETEMTAKLSPEIVQGWRDAIPLKRGGQTTDVANACLFLASDLSSYISGQVLNVDGGMLT